MKKLLGVLSLGLACTMMFGCTKPTPKPTPVDKDKILEVADFEKFSVVGNHSIVVDGADVDNEWAIKDYNVMTAVSLNQLAAIDADLEAKVEAKGVRGLYVKEGVVLGTRDGGWTAHYKDSEGVVQDANASYALKCAGAEENDDGVWIRGTHYTSPEAHGESLTPDLLWITDNMTAEAVDGFDHDSNPVALEAGVFTVVLALYKAGSELACGLGLVKTEAREAWVAPETNPVESMDMAGGFNSWTPTEADLLTKDGATFTGKLVLAAASEVKFRVNCAWSISLGATALSSKVITDNDDNINLEAATYNITITFKDATNVKIGDELEAFTIEPEGEVIHTAVPVESMTVSGTFNSWGDQAMDKEGNTFSTVIEFAGTEESFQFKVKVNGDWTYNFGGKLFNQEPAADNAWVEAAGKYDVSITLSEAAMADISLDQTVTAYELKAHVDGGDETEPTVLTVSIADLATANSWANGTLYASATLDEVISASVTDEGVVSGDNTYHNSGKYYSSDNTWRLYQNDKGKMTLAAAEGHTIVSIKVTYNIGNTGILLVGETQLASGDAFEVNAASVELMVGNTGTATNGQAKITAIEVSYR